jgi:hypothetical protein
VAIIDHSDLHVAWQYDGVSQSAATTSIGFSIDSEHNVPFEQLECFALDLENDPQRVHPIRPVLIDSDGVSKKVSVPFLKPLGRAERFSVILQCTLPGCVTTGLQYYTSSLSFDQPSVENAGVHLIFLSARPKWVEVYEVDDNGRVNYKAELRPFRDDGFTSEYVDMAQNVPGQSVRVYLYDLPSIPRQRASGMA